MVGSEKIVNSPRGTFDYIISVDASETKRLGNALDGYPQPDLNVDHHITNTLFGRHNLVISEAVATAEILAISLDYLGLPMTEPVANALLTGIVTDTIGFRTSNMNPQSLRIAADLMEAGGDLSGTYYPALIQRSLPAARYWGAGLSKLQRENGLVWTTLSLLDRQTVGYPGRDDADLVNMLSSIEGADVALIFIEQSVNRVKISWRLCGNTALSLDLSQVAQQFGGGGHKAAAGAEIEGSLSDVQARVLSATRSLLARNG